MKRKLLIWGVIIAVVAIVAYRIERIRSENARVVFNIARAEAEHGTPVEVMTVAAKTDTLAEPVSVKNGKASVSLARIGKFKIGQRLSAGGHVISVSRVIDLDTGLYAVKTSSPDGDMFINIDYTGIFVPNAAMTSTCDSAGAECNSVMLDIGGVATSRPVSIIATDAERSVVSGLNDGDVVVLTRVDEGTKIQSNAEK
ncbi:MAG: hypothetical protein FWC51_03790 [Proteobacteria bacterium]|nr:hypothetical protein [Pseudomonadota bacterium]